MPTHKKPPHHYQHYVKPRVIFRSVILGMLLYLIAAGFGGFQLSLRAISAANPVLLIYAASMIVGSFLAAAGTYWLLTPKKVPLHELFMVQIAGGLVNRLLPAGLGGLGLNAYYFVQKGYKVPVAAALVAANNVLGSIGNGLLLAFAGIFSSLNVRKLQLPELPWVVIMILICTVALAVVYVKLHHSYIRALVRFLRQAEHFAISLMRRPLASVGALMTSILVTSLHVVSLYLVINAIGADSSWPTALLAISIGAIMGAAVPTPGGLGGAEAGIAAVLIAFGMPAATAIAVALVYRGLAYWLPLVPGYIALRIVEKRYL